MNFVKSSLKYKQVTLAVLLLCFAVGVYSLFNMPRREDPKITIKQALVIAYYPGANSAQVEAQLTKKLEQYLFQFSEVNKIKTVSNSQDGLTVITVELTDAVKTPDVFWNKLRNGLLVYKQTSLPDGVIGPIVNSDFGDTEAMVIGLSGDNIPYAQLKTYAAQLEDQLRKIPSVSKIKRLGEDPEQITVATNSQQLAQYGINLTDVIKILQSQNNVYPTGNMDVASSKVPFYANGYYTNIDQLAEQVIGTSKTGAVIHLKDIATIQRDYSEPSSKITVDGQNAVMISIQMQEGNNIVKFGEAVEKTIEEFRQSSPSQLKLTTIVNQPEVVDSNISHFLREFFLAILSVVLVVILLLPFRIATVAAMAIPMTVAVTLAMMNMFGIELHQVSLAALIVVLGMVVDDAIVVADNYVELLDQGVERWEAAWRSASDLVKPIFVATITIIAAFMPMTMLSGAVGEFIRSLPLTVAIALASSFIIAMVFTPILCYTFIKKGLHDPDGKNKKQRKSLLDRMQSGYNSLLDWCVKRPRLTIFASILPIVAALLLYKFGIKQKFFPAAERNQFVIELWMPTGTKLDATETATHKLEKLLASDKRVLNYTSFMGTSAPRFYYNYSPEFPVTNYAQIVINTKDDKTAEQMFKELEYKVQSVVPEGMPQVKLMQQGEPLKAPIEVRISGDDVATLEKIGNQVSNIIRNTEGNFMVRNDFHEDYYGYDLNIKPDAQRLGFTTESIAKTVYAGFAGAPVTTIREGDNDVKVVFRMDEKDRQTTDNLNNTYMASPVTGAKVPLSQLVTLQPTWHTGRIMHRTGLKTLTVQSDVQDGTLASQLQTAIQPKIDSLPLPPGYHIEYGGEIGNQQKTFKEMVQALIVSVVLIFFILLFQFKKLKEAIIIMLSIPLSLFGAMLGLYLTNNNFGFTAFVGLISLSGIVVRNAIILIDHVEELIHKENMDTYTAAIESGKRRLRPIFLTASAAAIGVLPMILSGSQLWSPLASVIAFGVVWSMLMALITVPILYIQWIVPKDKRKPQD